MKVYLIGDSISLYYGLHLRNYLRGIANCSRKDGIGEGLLDLEHPQGSSGGDSGMVLGFLQAKVEARGIDADVVLFNCGLHDIKTDPSTGAKLTPLNQYRENLKAILDVLATMAPKPVWVRTTPCDEAVHNRPGCDYQRFSGDCRAYNQAADRIMAEGGVPSLDLYTFTMSLGPNPYCDHVHFHDHVCEKQAAYIAGWLAALTSDMGTEGN